MPAANNDYRVPINPPPRGRGFLAWLWNLWQAARRLEARQDALEQRVTDLENQP